MIEVIDLSFNDQEMDWCPEDPFDFHEWVSVTVGEAGVGNNYQVHLCASATLSQLESKDYVFAIPGWVSLEDTVDKLNGFIQSKLADNVKYDDFQLLGKYWAWEYEGYS